MEIIKKWHQVVKEQDIKLLKSILANDAIFYSPLLFKPKKGKAQVAGFLMAASKMFEGNDFHYVKEIIGSNEAMLEFNATIDGILVDGVDIITWNDDEKITEFKVMIRPFTAIEKVGEKMKSLLEEMSLWDKIKLKVS